ncbi:MAG: DUF1579 family protein [Ktedonobacteraceae bacterium]|nr:DUF1579 family protein [Ktedonobacteraceae bacterium]
MIEHESNLSPSSPTSQEESASNVLPPARQFDFWLGEWDLTWADGGRGTNSIQAILDGHVILENFDADPAGSFRGMSFSVYDPAQNQWQQTWVDNQGGYLDLVGTYQNDTMILTRQAMTAGKAVMQRMIFYNISTSQLDWDWQRSEDEGRTWKTLWHIHYQRKSSPEKQA